MLGNGVIHLEGVSPRTECDFTKFCGVQLKTKKVIGQIEDSYKLFKQLDLTGFQGLALAYNLYQIRLWCTDGICM